MIKGKLDLKNTKRLMPYKGLLMIKNPTGYHNGKTHGEGILSLWQIPRAWTYLKFMLE